MSAGNVKRDHIHAAKEEMKAQGKPVDEGSIAENLPEQEVRGREGESARREGGERKGEYVGNGRGGRRGCEVEGVCRGGRDRRKGRAGREGGKKKSREIGGSGEKERNKEE